MAERFAYLAWSIWNKRNQERLQSTSLPFSRLYQDMCERLREFKSIQEDPQPGPIHSEVTHWTPPQNSQLKVNYDGAVFNDFQQAGVGVVVRDAAGGVCGALSDRYTLPMNVEDIEALACRAAVVFALELGLREVVFEGDSKIITKAFNSALPCLSSFCHIIDDVKTLALNFVSASFVHVKRQGNAVVDRLAKTAKCIPCPHIWSVDLPCNVQQLVIDDSISVD